MTQVGARPVPARRKDLLTRQNTAAKLELVNSFTGFNASTVSEKHMHLARECIKQIPVRSARFEHVPFHMILQWNQDKPNYPSMIAQACDLLLKYVINLLKPKRPQVWRSIKTTNSHFCARVDCMVGARDILAKIGYSEAQGDSAMQFPDSVQEPDKEKLHVIAAELLMAKLEAEGLPCTPLSLQSSNPETGSPISRQSSHPGTPNSQMPQPRVSHLPPHDSHVTSYASHVTPGSMDGQMRTALMYSEPTTNAPPSSHGLPPASHVGTPNSAYNVSQHSGQYQFSNAVPSQPSQSPIQPTEAFSLHPGLASNYELPVRSPSTPRNIPKTPQSTLAPQISKTPPASDHSEPGSSEESNYGTPPSSPTPGDDDANNTLNSSTSSTSSELMKELDLLKKKRMEMKNKQSKSRSADQTAGELRDHETKRKTNTSVLNQPSNAPKRQQTREKPRHGMKPILEEPATSGSSLHEAMSVVASTAARPPASVPPATLCLKCKNAIKPGQTLCDFCHSFIGQFTSSMLPPPMVPTETGLMKMSSEEQPHPKPLRASASSAEEAIQHHRRTRAFPAAMQGPHGGDVGVGVGASGGGEGGAVMGGRGSGMVGMSEVGRRDSGAVEGEHRGAEGGSVSATGTNEKSYKEIMEEKERVWKEEWRKRGYADDEIPSEPGSVPLPSPKKAPKEAPKVRKPPQKKKIPYDQSKSTTKELERYKIEAQQRERMEHMGKEGKYFIDCIKLCVQYGYSLEEVELAYRRCQGPNKQKEVLNYLKRDWAGCVREVQQYVVGMVDQQGRNVGCPSELEARKYLVHTDGNVMTASHKVYAFRKKKIEELQRKFKPYSELEWNAAEQALSAFDMSVERAACSIQCEMLQPLYEFIFSEWTEVPATDMKKIKDRLKLKINKEGAGKEASMRMLMGEYKLPSIEKAAMVLDLMNQFEVGEEDYPLSYYIDAARDFSTLEDAERGLFKECPICVVSYPVHEMIIMPGCTDTMCKDCFKGTFKVVITEKGVKHFNCPQCDLPDMTNRDDAQDLYQELFVHLIHEHLPEHYDLVQHKLAERNLQKEPGFCWCASEGCVSCFINPDLQRKKIQCPSCNKLMCFQCKKPWEDQHHGLSCEDFAEWKRQNDPKFQKEGLAAHLQANGIECPDCHMRYELARGGCMHFKCTRCPNEFCSGCGGSFKKAQACGRFQSCAARGLHAHHPRDCLYFMRDFTVEQLQDFLRKNNVEFLTDPSQEQLEAVGEEKKEGGEGAEIEGEGEGGGGGGGGVAEAGDGDVAAAEVKGKKVVLMCSAMLQKEIVDKLVDEACGDVVKDGHAGLCERHYKEYLVDRINKAKLDPLPLYEKIEVILQREEKPVPEKEDEETDEDYRERLIVHVKQELPLQRGRPDVQPLAEGHLQPEAEAIVD